MLDGMLDAGRIAPVDEARGDVPGQAQGAVEMPEQRQTAVSAEGAAVERGDEFS